MLGLSLEYRLTQLLLGLSLKFMWTLLMLGLSLKFRWTELNEWQLMLGLTYIKQRKPDQAKLSSTQMSWVFLPSSARIGLTE